MTMTAHTSGDQVHIAERTHAEDSLRVVMRREERGNGEDRGDMTDLDAVRSPEARGEDLDQDGALRVRIPELLRASGS